MSISRYRHHCCVLNAAVAKIIIQRNGRTINHHPHIPPSRIHSNDCKRFTTIILFCCRATVKVWVTAMTFGLLARSRWDWVFVKCYFIFTVHTLQAVQSLLVAESERLVDGLCADNCMQSITMPFWLYETISQYLEEDCVIRLQRAAN